MSAEILPLPGSTLGLDAGDPFDPSNGDPVQQWADQIFPALSAKVPPERGAQMSRRDAAAIVSDFVIDALDAENIELDLLQQRALVTLLTNRVMAGETPKAAVPSPIDDVEVLTQPIEDEFATPKLKAPEPAHRTTVFEAKREVKPVVLDRIDVGRASALGAEQLNSELSPIISEITRELRLQLNQSEHAQLVSSLVDDMIGLGPLEPLLADDTVSDIMVNGPKQVYVERRGKLEISDVTFQDDQHVINVATRIVTRIGRRIDESHPICDARLADGSRVNVVIPPLAIDGPSMSIRKFSKRRITLDRMAQQGNMSAGMAKLLKIAGRSRLNILISGGTGSGKTTLLNALSQLIDPGERVVTIEDAAELQLQQPHVVRLETRPASLEGKGEITIRDLVKNALRMRPDRIIIGEIRGGEAVDMLQAMNTGHEGSMCTVHANRPRDALTRLENMVGLAAVNLPAKAVRIQIASAIDLVVQVQRMRDGVRRVTNVSEVCGMEGEVIITQDIYNYTFEGEDERGRLVGSFKSAGVRPSFTQKAEYFGLGRALLEVI